MNPSRTLSIVLELQDKASQQLQSFEGGIKNMQPAFKRMAGVGSAAFAGISGTIAVSSKVLGENADRLLDLQAITGISTDTLQEFQQVARTAGVDNEALTSAVSGLSRRMPGLISGTGNAHDAMESLGISVRDSNGEIRNTEDVMLEAMQAIGGIDNELERAAAANQIFGRRWEELAPIMALGSDGIDEARQRAHDLGLVMDGDTLLAANNLRIETETLFAQVGALRDRLAIAFIPVLLELVDKVQPIIAQFRSWMENNEELTKKIVMAALAISGIVAVVGTLGLLLIPLIASFKAVAIVVALLASPFGIIIALIAVIIATIAFLVMNWEQHWEAIKWAFGVVVDWIVDKWDSIKDFFGGVIDWIGDKIRTGFDSFRTFISSFANFFIGIGESIGNAWIAMVNGIINALNRIQFNIPDWVPGIGGNSFGINIPNVPNLNIPRLAEGGIVTRSILANVGEAGPEAIIPLDRVGDFGGGVTVNVYGDVSGTELIERVKSGIMQELGHNIRLTST